MEQKEAEEQRAIYWAAKWSTVRERVRTVASNALQFLPELVVDLEEEKEDTDVEDT